MKKSVKITKNKEVIKLRLEFFDKMIEEVRFRIKQGEPIPTMKILLQP